jgi:hypothetical protein
MWKRWAENTGASLLAAVIIALIPGAIVTYLAKIQSAWTTPLLLGMTAATLAAVIILALDAIRRLPPRRVIPTTENIESCVRDWLNNFLCSVKKAPIENAYFRYLVTLGSGTKVLVGRVKGDLQDYLQIRADLNPGPDDLKKFVTLTQLEQAVVLSNIRLEMARRHIGYRNLAIPANDAHLFKRIPIRETLTEHEFIGAVEEVEAAILAVGLVFALEFVKTGKFPVDDLKTLDAPH